MKQAILITAYKNLDHLTKIADQFTEDFQIYIHIDKKTMCDEKVLHELNNHPRIVFVSQAYQSNWGGINHLRAILLLCQEAIKYTSAKYIHLITGHDYPIKSAEYFSEFLERNKGKEFISIIQLPSDKWKGGGLNRISYYWFYDKLNGKSWQRVLIKSLVFAQRILLIKRSLPPQFKTLYGGTTYWTLSREAVSYILDYLDENPELLKRFKHTFCAEEILFHSILMNSKFKDQVTANDLRYIVWKERNGNLPANLDATDLPNILKSDGLFARKFEYPVSQELLELLEDKDSAL